MAAERDDLAVDEIKLEIESTVQDWAGSLRMAGLSESEITDSIAAAVPSSDERPRLHGVPISEVCGLTLDGRRWLEVLGEIHREVQPGGSVYLTFRVAQAPGGKARKDGIDQGDTIAVHVSRVVAVQRKPAVRVRSVGDSGDDEASD